MRALVVVLVACGTKTAPEPPPTTTCPADDKARLTIVTGTLPAGCEGGVFMIDGQAHGKYPVSCAEVPAGRHVVDVQSANDCAGYMRCKLEFFAGGETIFDLRSPSCGAW